MDEREGQGMEMRKEKDRYSRLASVLTKLLVAALCLLAWGLYTSGKNPIPYRRAEGLDISVFNSSCRQGDLNQPLSYKAVGEPAVAAQILALCKTAGDVSPLSAEPVLGGISAPYVLFTQKNTRYLFSFGTEQDLTGQLAAHSSTGQEALFVFLYKQSAKADGWHTQRAWVGTMPAEDYANLYGLLESCTDGPEISAVP